MVKISKNTSPNNGWSFGNLNTAIAIATIISAIAAIIPTITKHHNTPLISISGFELNVIDFIAIMIASIAFIIAVTIAIRTYAKDRNYGSLNDFEAVLCRIVAYTDQCDEVDKHFSSYSKRNRGVFFIEGPYKDKPEILPQHLVIRQKPHNYDALKSEGSVDLLLTQNLKILTSMPKRKDDFVPYLGFKMGTDGEPDATQKAVADWVNNNVENKRKIIYVPLDNQVRNKEGSLWIPDWYSGLSLGLGRQRSQDSVGS